MKLIIILLLAFAVSSNAQILLPISSDVHHSGGGATFYSRSITVDHTKVPSTDQTNFTVVVTGTYSYLATVANGGKVSNASGYDIVFATDNTCVTRLDWEIVNWSATTGTVEYWIRVPTLTTASDYVFYVCYGDASITTDQSNRTGTWNTNFKGIFHYGSPSSLSLNDSTSNGNDGTNHGLSAASGQIGGAWSSTGSPNYATTGLTGFPTGSADRTVSAWLYKTSTNLEIAVNYGTASDLAIFGLYINNVTPTIEGYGSGHDTPCTTNITLNTWNYIVGTFVGTGTVTCYVNGVAAGTGSHAIATGSTGSWLGGNVPDAAFYWTGSSDEYHVSDVVRSADWIATEYNNQSSPSTFYTIGSEVPH